MGCFRSVVMAQLLLILVSVACSPGGSTMLRATIVAGDVPVLHKYWKAEIRISSWFKRAIWVGIDQYSRSTQATVLPTACRYATGRPGADTDGQ
jgi:hypothetical protein